MEAVKSYRVKVTRVQGTGRKTYKFNEVVTSQNFPDGIAEILEKNGYLESVKGEQKTMTKEEAKAAVKEAQAAVKEAKEALDAATEENEEALFKALDEKETALSEAKKKLAELK